MQLQTLLRPIVTAFESLSLFENVPEPVSTTARLGDASLQAIKPIHGAAGIALRSEEQIPTLVEAPLVSACILLYRGGIRTHYTSAHTQGRTAAQLWVERDSLTQSQALRAQQLGCTGMLSIDGRELLIFVLPFHQHTSCSEVCSWGYTIARNLLDA
jgi:hypothetical protein